MTVPRTSPAGLLSEAFTATRFLVRLPRFLRRPLDRVEAERTLRRRLARREADFLDLTRRAVYEHRESPYRPLLRASSTVWPEAASG